MKRCTQRERKTFQRQTALNLEHRNHQENDLPKTRTLEKEQRMTNKECEPDVVTCEYHTKTQQNLSYWE